MATRSSLIGQTYLNPQIQQAPMQPQAPYNDGIQAMEGLQAVQDMTGDYYRKVGELKSFMQSAYKNFGVDVRVPDASRPESIRMNQIFNEALADIMAQGNELKQSSSLNMIRDQRGVIYNPNIDQNATPASQLRSGQDFWERPLEQSITQTNDLTQREVYDDRAYAQKLAQYEATKAQYEEMAKDPRYSEYASYQLRGLTAPTQAIKQFAPQRPTSYDKRLGNDIKISGNVLKELINLKNMGHDSYQPSLTKFNDNGVPYLVSNQFQGLPTGEDDRYVSRFEIDPENPNKFLLYEQNKKGQIYANPRELGSTDMKALAATISGKGVDAVISFVQDNKLEDQFGQVLEQPLIGEDINTKKEVNLNKSKTVYNEKTNKLSKVLDDKLKAIRSFNWGGADVSGDNYKSWGAFSGGSEVVSIGKYKIANTEDGGFTITNLSSLIPQGKLSTKDYLKKIETESKHKNLVSLKEYLIQKGIYKDLINEEVLSGTQIAPVQPAVQQPQGEFNPANY